MTGALSEKAAPVHVLVIGASRDAVFSLQTSLAALQPDVAVASLPTLGNLPEVANPPDIVVVLQEHPEQISSQQVRDLLNAFALSRLIVSCGPWCISDGRTRQLWPAACRVPALRLLPRLRRELAVVRGAAAPLPLTADRDECWEDDFAAPRAVVQLPLRLRISTPDPAVDEWLTDALTAAGHHIVHAPDAPADVLLFDVDPWRAQRLRELRDHLQARLDLPVVALAADPRGSEQRALGEAGVRSLVMKLAPLSELCQTLAEASGASRSAGPILQVVSDQ